MKNLTGYYGVGTQFRKEIHIRRITPMLDVREYEEGIVDEAAASVQAEQGKLKQTLNQITKRVPQLMVLAATVIASVDPNTISLPPHPR
jgi:hypothetical protein